MARTVVQYCVSCGTRHETTGEERAAGASCPTACRSCGGRLVDERLYAEVRRKKEASHGA